jgi:hypothetical protein
LKSRRRRLNAAQKQGKVGNFARNSSAQRENRACASLGLLGAGKQRRTVTISAKRLGGLSSQVTA